MNVLLTSSGRRTYLCEYFRKALQGEGLLFATNSCMSPALTAADGYGISPMIYSEAYLPYLLRFCKEHEIGLLVPLFDIDLPVLSASREAFQKEGVTLAVSSPEVVAFCNDKYRMAEKLSEAGIGCPKTEIAGEKSIAAFEKEDRWPVVVKPRFGMGSIGVEMAYTPEELRVLAGHCRRKIETSYLKYEAASCPGESVILQQAVNGREYGLDVINDFGGKFRTVVVKEKAAMRAGETDEAVTLGTGDPAYEVLYELGRKIASVTGHIGNMDVDVLMDPAEKKPVVIDMNARFGGGYPFSHAAGIDLPKAYVCWAVGKEPPKECFTAKPGVHCYKDLKISSYEV